MSSTMVGLWMSNPEEAAVMERALEARLRNIGVDHPDRAKLMEWRRQAMNLSHRATREEWMGWKRLEPTK